MSNRIRARLVVRRLVDYRHAGGQGQGMLMDLSQAGLSDRITDTPPFPVGRVYDCNSGFPTNPSL